MRKKWLGIALVVFAFPAVLFYVLNRHAAEPAYKGKRISFWIEPLFDPNTQEWEKAAKEEKEAVRAIGTNGIPYYLECLQAQDSGLKTRILHTLELWSANHNMSSISRFAFIHTATTKREFAFAALGILQTNALPAVPTVIKLLEESDDDLKRDAAMLLVEIGLQRVSAITNALASTNAVGKRELLLAFGEYGNHGFLFHLWEGHFQTSDVLAANAKVITPILIDYISDTNKPNRDCALLSLGSFLMDPSTESKALPIFAKCCEESDGKVRNNARFPLVLAVHDRSTNALNVLVGLLQNTNATIRCEALQSLQLSGSDGKSALPAIKGALTDPEIQVRTAASNALAEISARSGL